MLCSCGHQFIRYVCYNCGNVDETSYPLVKKPKRLIEIPNTTNTNFKYGIWPKKNRVRKSLRLNIFKRDGNACLKCLSVGCKNNPLTIDHIIPLIKGGLNRKNNLQTLCYVCNHDKGEEIIDYRKK